MTTTAAVEKAAAKPADKVEKRRALGRGLDSLLPGPRVVVPPVSRPAGPFDPAQHSQPGAAGPALHAETIEIQAVAEEERASDSGAAPETGIPPGWRRFGMTTR